MAKESEYKELFLSEAKESLEQLEGLYVDLEKDNSNQGAIREIFRITHTLKGNSMAMGFNSISDLSHVIEDVMLALQEQKIEMSQELFKLLFRANDKLGGLVKSLETNEKVSFLGIKTSLSLFLQKSIKEPQKKKETQEESSESENSSSQITFSDFIQIPIKKMDELMNEVGQLIIERDRLTTISEQLGFRSSELDALKRISSNLQYSIMNVRMVPVGFLFNKFHRVVRDAAVLEQKSAGLTIKNAEIEIDRNVLKTLSDSLIHLVRNAVSHGIESKENRKNNKKKEQGEIILDAAYERDRVVISITDDGNGIDTEAIRKKLVDRKLLSPADAANLKPRQVIEYIFEAGFSNAQKTNELSGRGVGMDVVKKSVESIGGQVKIQTELGFGTKIELHVPASLALKGTLLFEVTGQQYAIALSYSEAVISREKRRMHTLGDSVTTDFEEDIIPIVFLKDILEMKDLEEISNKSVFKNTFDQLAEDSLCEILVVSYGNNITGIAVDKVLQQKEIIEKPLARPLENIQLISGSTILGTGEVCPVIDIAVLTNLVHQQSLKLQNEKIK